MTNTDFTKKNENFLVLSRNFSYSKIFFKDNACFLRRMLEYVARYLFEKYVSGWSRVLVVTNRKYQSNKHGG